MHLMNPVWGMIHNLKENKWHPVVFEEKPLPGPPSDDKPVRWKSKGHHTDGFDSRDDAMVSLKETALQTSGSRYLTILDDPEQDYPWDGEGVPTLVQCFLETVLADECPKSIEV